MPFETVLTYALYFFALNYLMMFGAFFLFNDWALRFLFRYPLRPVLANSPSEDTLRWTSIGMIFHRMEATTAWVSRCWWARWPISVRVT